MLALFASLALLASASANDETFDTGIGLCTNGTRNVLRLEELTSFDHQSVDLRRFGMPLSAKVADETLFLERGDKRVHFYRIDRLISPKSDIDIDAKIVVFENRPVLIWQETFKHRPARFGVMSIEGEKVTPKCEGLTGAPMIE